MTMALAFSGMTLALYPEEREKREKRKEKRDNRKEDEKDTTEQRKTTNKQQKRKQVKVNVRLIVVK